MAGGFPEPRRDAQLLALGRGAARHPAGLQPAHPLARGLARRGAARPQHLSDHPHARRPALPRDRRGGGARPEPQPRRVPRRRRAPDHADDRHHRAAHALPDVPAAVADRLARAARAGGEPGLARQFPHLRAGAGRRRLRLPLDLPPPERAERARPRTPIRTSSSAATASPPSPARAGAPSRPSACRSCSIRADRSSGCSRRSPRRRRARPRPSSRIPTRTRWPRR